MQYVTRHYLKRLLPKRHDWSRKGDFGKLLVVGGSRRYSGAPAHAAMAALRTGCDIVTVAAPERAADIIASFSPDLITFPLNCHYLSNWHVGAVAEMAKDADAIVLGGGLERRRDTLSFALNLLRRIDKPCVIDADAIHAVALDSKVLKPSFVLTPHGGEFRVLAGSEPPREASKRAAATKGLAKSLGCTVLLKGHIDFISDGKELLANKTGTPFMTKGGTGDSLSGICGAFLAMGLSPFDSACIAAHINGVAGDIVSKRLGQGMLTSDLISSIPEAIAGLMK